MSAMLQYVYQSNIRRFTILLLAFTGIQLVLFLNMKVLHIFPTPAHARDYFSFGLFVLSSIVFGVLIFVQTLSAFRRLIRQTMVRTAPISSAAIVAAPLLAWFIGTILFTAILLLIASLYTYTTAKDAIVVIWPFLQQLGMQGVWLSILFLLSSFSILVQIFFCITLAKSVRIQRKLQILIAFVSFFLISALIMTASDYLHTIGPVVLTLLEFDPEPINLTLLGSLFDLASFVGLLFGTAYFIDKRVEG